jgi:Ca2+-binding RTX toxin-like protein
LLGGLGDDSLFGGSGNDVLFAGDVIDSVDARFSVELLDGGDGNDLLIAARVPDDAVFGFGFFNNLMIGGAGNDSLFGFTRNDLMEGGAGNDLLSGGGGNDTLRGGEGNDVLTADRTPTATRSTAFLNGGDGNDLIFGSPFQDFIYTEGGFDVVAAGDGSDYIVTGRREPILPSGEVDLVLGDPIRSGPQLIDGGADFDVWIGDFRAQAAPVAVSFSGAAGLSGFTSNGITLFNVETMQVLGSRFADSIRGGQSADTIAGGAGADIVDGGAESDLILGEAGNNILLGGDGDDTLVTGRRFGPEDATDELSEAFLETGVDRVEGGAGMDSWIADYTLLDQAIQFTLDTSGPDAVSRASNGTTVRGVENMIFVATAFDDVVIGGDSFDRLRGLAGADRLEGRGGVDLLAGGIGGGDTLLGGDDFDFLFFDPFGAPSFADGGDSIDRSTVDYSTAPAGVTIRLLSPDQASTLPGGHTVINIEAITIIGTAFADTVTADPGHIGGFEGGAGNDVYVGADSRWLDRYAGGEGDDVLIASPLATVLLSGDQGDDSLVGGAGDDTLTDFAGNDTIEGRAGNDLIDAGDGDDLIDGGDGADFINAGQGADSITAGEGDDVVGGLFGDDSIDGGAGADELFGGTGRDRIFGGDGADSLGGGPDDDVLSGGFGDDRLETGSGLDTATGGAGADFFVYGSRAGAADTGDPATRETITDFSRSDGDRIDLTEIDAVVGNGVDDAFVFVGLVDSLDAVLGGQCGLVAEDGTTVLYARASGVAPDSPILAISLLGVAPSGFGATDLLL